MKPFCRRKVSMSENDWDLWAVVRSCSNFNSSVHDDQRSHDYVDIPVDGNSGNNTETPTISLEQSDCFGDFSELFTTENKRYFGLDEVCDFFKNANTNSRIKPHNPENPTETIPNTPLLIEHEEKKNKKLLIEHGKRKKKKGSYSILFSSTEEGKTFSYRGKSTERHEILAEKLSEADQWRWRKYGMKRTSDSPLNKSYYKCNEVEDCPGRRHVQQSSTDPNKVIITYRGQHNHPPNQDTACTQKS